MVMQRARTSAALALSIGASACLVLSSACSPGSDGGDVPEGRSANSGAGAGTAEEAMHRGAGDPRANSVKEPGTEPPQLILLLSLDTLRADHLGMYGYERSTSPVLDNLASEGVIFEDASSPTPWTLPAHASMLTGLNPLSHGVVTRYTGLPKRIPTLADLLAKQGYDTAAVVNSNWLTKKTFRLTRHFDKYLFVQPVASRTAPSTWVTDQAITWLEEMGNDRLFLFVHYYDIHSDYSSLPEFEKLFVSPYEGRANGTTWQLQRAGLSETHLKICSKDLDETRWNRVRKTLCIFGGDHENYVIDHTTETIEFDERDFQHMAELYDAGIRQLDTELGRLFTYLDEAGILEKALIVVVSDHGESLGEHGEVDHYLTTYQEVLRVPLIIRGPGIPRNRRISTPVSLVDLTPTILRIAQAPLPDAMDGIDLSPLWRGGSTHDFDHRLIYGEAAGGVNWSVAAPGVYPEYRSIRRASHKIVYISDGERYTLFDLTNDPGELHDVSAQEPELFAELKHEMMQRYRNFSPKPTKKTKVQLNQENIEQLRKLGYVQ
jgi:arylsulfatase A-like enzyme